MIVVDASAVLELLRTPVGRRVEAGLFDTPVPLHAPHLLDIETAYDAAYVALAEALEAILVTGDARLARAPGHSASIEVID